MSDTDYAGALQTASNLGQNGFVWFIGLVESRNDPLFLGRVQVRVYNWHSSALQLIPTNDLPWALPLMPPGSNQQHAIKEGSFVMGYFMDGQNGQVPVILGWYPGIPEFTPPANKGFSDQRSQAQLKTSPRPPASRTYNSDGSGVKVSEQSTAQRYPYNINVATGSAVAYGNNSGTVLADSIKNVVTNVPTANGTSWSEPKSSYATKYPYNDVNYTESGHLIENDDTFGAERLSRFHRSGTFEEIGPDGRKVIKVANTSYDIKMADENKLVMGNQNETVNKDKNIYAKGSITLQSDHEITINAAGGVIIVNGGSLFVDGSLGTGIGATGTFTSAEGDVVSVLNGIITNIF